MDHDSGDESDGEEKAAEIRHRELWARMLHWEPIGRDVPSILFLSYSYSLGSRVRYPDHDLGDEDRTWSGWVRPRQPYNPIRSNPPRPRRAP